MKLEGSVGCRVFVSRASRMLIVEMKEEVRRRRESWSF